MINVLENNIGNLKDELLSKWDRDGYLILDNTINMDVIDQLNNEFAGLWKELLHDGECVFNGMLGNDGGSCDIKQKDFLKMDSEKREHLINNCNWRIHGLFKVLGAAKNIAYNPIIQDIVHLLIGKEAPPMASINFYNGSGQSIHQDQAVFHSYPEGKLIGCWVALEDIHPESGPVTYYPKSHKEAMFYKFDNYPQTNLRTFEVSQHDEYYNYISDIASKYDKKEFIAKKGQLLLWHAGLLHGGSEIKNQKLTRKSFVVHYMPPACNYHDKVKGPFNWQ